MATTKSPDRPFMFRTSLLDDDPSELPDVLARGVAVRDVAGRRRRLGRAPSPDGHTERAARRHVVATVVARALRLEVVAHEVDARVLEEVGRPDRLPPSELARAVERDVGEAALAARSRDD